MESNNYTKLMESLSKAKQICPPDEYNLRHRQLLHVIADYLLNRDMPEEMKIKNNKSRKDANELHEFIWKENET